MQVVNVRGLAANDPSITYIGRGSGGWAASPLGNPCSIPGVACPICQQTHFGQRMVQLTESRSIECYRKWLWGRIRSDDRVVINAILALKADDKLGCWCKPKSCHGDVLIKAWEWCSQWELGVKTS